MRIDATARTRASRIRALLFDVDGVLTDGGLLYGEGGQELKRFNVQDGIAVRQAQQAGLLTGVITGRDGEAVRRRSAELDLDFTAFGCADKLEAYRDFKQRFALADDEIAFVGDDAPDLAVLERCGLACAPADAHAAARSTAALVTRRKGGSGALREVADFILAAQTRPEPSDPEPPSADALPPTPNRLPDEPGRDVHVAPNVVLSNERPFALLAGMNVLESRDLAFRVAETLVRATEALGVAYVFKASFDKANRSSIDSYRGPGLDEGLALLQQIKQHFGVPILTDIHEPTQAEPVAEVADVLQIPAFLVRQTDLLTAACQTGRPLHIKKMQMMAPHEMGNVLRKCEALGHDQLIVCERGTSFGYGNLVVDPLSFPQLKAFGYPVTFDVTHALQMPGALGASTGGRGAYVENLALAGMSQGLAGLFLECHPDPAQAKCDGPCALPLDQVQPLLQRLKALDDLVKRLGQKQPVSAPEQA